jgi:hypothetical protein
MFTLPQEGLVDGPEGALVTYELADAAFQVILFRVQGFRVFRG